MLQENLNIDGNKDNKTIRNCLYFILEERGEYNNNERWFRYIDHSINEKVGLSIQSSGEQVDLSYRGMMSKEGSIKYVDTISSYVIYRKENYGNVSKGTLRRNESSTMIKEL